jgi:hypothetical protein
MPSFFDSHRACPFVYRNAGWCRSFNACRDGNDAMVGIAALTPPYRTVRLE